MAFAQLFIFQALAIPFVNQSVCNISGKVGILHHVTFDLLRVMDNVACQSEHTSLVKCCVPLHSSDSDT